MKLGGTKKILYRSLRGKLCASIVFSLVNHCYFIQWKSHLERLRHSSLCLILKIARRNSALEICGRNLL